MAIKITGTFIPGGDFGLLEDKNLIGGYVSVADTTERDNIPELKRKWGMLVYVQNEDKFYQLTDTGNGDLSDNSNWQEAQFGSNLNAENGLTIENNTIKLGGQLTKDTTIDTQDKTLIIHHPSSSQPNADWSFGNAISHFQYSDPNDINKQVNAYITKDYFALYVGSSSNFYLENPDALYSDTRLNQRGEIAHLGYINGRAGTIRVRLKADSAQPVDEQGGPYTIDGVETQEGDILYLSAQDDAKDNGIYIYTNGGITRHPDFPEGFDVSYYLVAVAEGNSNKNTIWQFKHPGVLGTDDILSDLVAKGSTANGYTFTNGLIEDNGTVKLGGQLTEHTNIHLTTNYRLTLDNNGGDANKFEIDFGDKRITAAVQGGSLLEGANLNVRDTYVELGANKDNGDMTSTHYYLKIDNEKTISSNAQTVKIKNDEYGITQINLENANSSDNYAGASIVVTASDTAYQDNTYISHLSAGFYVPAYRNCGLVYSDKTLWIGNPYSTDEKVNFVIGEEFAQPREKMILDKYGLHLTDLTKLYYEEGAKDYDIDDITKISSINIDTDSKEVLGSNARLPRKYVKYSKRLGAKYVAASKTLDFGIYFRKDPSRVKITVNGTPLEYGTDWDWSQFPQMPVSSPLEVDYTTKILLKNAPSDPDDVYELFYEEYIIDSVQLDARLITWLGNSMADNVRPKMITKYIDINGTKYYLSDVTKVDTVTYDCEYTNENDSNDKRTIRKRHFNAVYFPEFLPNEDLNFEVEIWRENPAQSNNNKTTYYNRPPKQLSGHLVPAWRTNKNLIVFGNSGSLKWRTRYFVRFRFKDQSGNYYFSEFQPYKIQKRYFNIFTINVGWGTTEEYRGIYETLKIVY